MRCANCGRITHYILATPKGSVGCCGRLRCEVKLRDGIDLPDPPPPQRTIEVRELRAALRDAIGHGQCPPGCEDCWVCRGRTLLDGATT